MIGDHSRFAVAVGISVAVFAFFLFEFFLRAKMLCRKKKAAEQEKIPHDLFFIAART
jgi:phosphotransferase system  glucose/maltose/N-acetylglucosamine-specific IIC component